MDKLTVSKSIGKRIASFRKARGLTQTQLAESVGVSQSMMAHYENGGRNIPVAVLLKCAGQLDITAAELLGETLTMARKPGPQSLLEKQLLEVRKLPRSEQQFISKLLDKVISAAVTG